LQNHSLRDGLGQVAFPRSSRAKKQSVLSPADESACRQVEDQAAIDFGIEAEVEVVERAIRIAEAGLFAAAFQQPVGATGEFVGDQARDQVDWCHGFGLRLAQPGFEHGGHTAQSQLAKRNSSSTMFMFGPPDEFGVR
jgi:hypothetical protein